MCSDDYTPAPSTNDVPDLTATKRPGKKVSVTLEESPKPPKPEPTEPRQRDSDYGYRSSYSSGRC